LKMCLRNGRCLPVFPLKGLGENLNVWGNTPSTLWCKTRYRIHEVVTVMWIWINVTSDARQWEERGACVCISVANVELAHKRSMEINLLESLGDRLYLQLCLSLPLQLVWWLVLGRFSSMRYPPIHTYRLNRAWRTVGFFIRILSSKFSYEINLTKRGGNCLFLACVILLCEIVGSNLGKGLISFLNPCAHFL
jgi:hypothetical protein